jgi:A/G-specific adenine glycosylase
MSAAAVLHSALLDWYRANRRDLPWRSAPDPYAVWVSEFMLQQTTVAAVVPFFHRWMARFPTVQTLARAEEADVLAAWQGLGYYRRARNLLAGARIIVQTGWPQSVAEWRALPGVGPYTAGAIASISQNLPAALVDGNVERVYARLNADASEGATLTRNAWTWAEAHLEPSCPGDWNQALMELGATVCRPVAPECGRCPVAFACQGHQTGTATRYPTPKPKAEKVILQHQVWVSHRRGQYAVRQIAAGRWWEGMWEFPREDASPAGTERLLELLGDGPRESLGSFRHVVTKHQISVEIWLHSSPNADSKDVKWVSLEESEALALPAPMQSIRRLIHARAAQGTFEL